jgi:hypothetical protein
MLLSRACTEGGKSSSSFKQACDRRCFDVLFQIPFLVDGFGHDAGAWGEEDEEEEAGKEEIVS